MDGAPPFMARRRESPKTAIWKPMPKSLEQAFEEIDSLETGHPHARGTTYGGIRNAETRDIRSMMNSEAR
jgi:hypothetical protein